ncbi:MAG: EAL domain-containing protein [Microthrixaceae bacterium]
MYRAKERGGGWWVYSRHQDDRDVRRLELMSDLRDAIESGQLQVHYQPRIDLAGAVPVGLEALVRWNHPVHGLLAPEEFIELAEVSGCIGALTRFVTTRAVHETADLLTDGALVLSVNLSSRNLHDPALVEWLRELLGERASGRASSASRSPRPS